MPGKIETAIYGLHIHSADPSPPFCGSVDLKEAPVFLNLDTRGVESEDLRRRFWPLHSTDIG